MCQMQLVKYAIVTFLRRSRPDTVADRLVLEVAIPSGPVGQSQVLGLDLGNDTAVCEDRVGGCWRRDVGRVRLTLLLGKDDGVDIVVETAA